MFDQADRINREASVCKEKYRIKQDDILITSKGSVIKTAIIENAPPEAYISGNITMLRVDQSKYNPYVLLEYLNSKQGRIALERIQSGTTIRILSNARLKALKVPEYEFSGMKDIGERLKMNQQTFYEEKRKLEEQFFGNRESLLKELERLK